MAKVKGSVFMKITLAGKEKEEDLNPVFGYFSLLGVFFNFP